MKVLLLAPQPFYQNRGTPIAVRMLAEELQAAGHSVDLLVLHEGEEVEMGGVRLLRTPAIPGISAIGPGFSWKKLLCDGAMLIKALRLCRQNSYDVVHAVEEAVFLAMPLKLLYRRPYIYDVDSWMSDQLVEKYAFLNFFRPLFSFLERRAVRYGDGAVVVCAALEERIRQIDEDIPLLRLEDVSLLADAPCPHESLEDICGGGDIVLYVGNLEKYQGVDLLLEAFAQVAAADPEISLVIIGGAPDSLEKYRRRAEELAIAARVFFIGPRPLANLGMYLGQASLLVSPRIEGENTPMKIYSYMASGRPVLATRIRSHTQVLDESTALLAEPDPGSLAEALLRGLREKEEAEKRGKAAKARAEQHYSRAAFNRKLTTFYAELEHVWNMRN